MKNQLTIFDVIQNDKFKELLETVKEYGIDKIYNEEFKDKCETLKTIHEMLEKQKNYKIYQKKILNLLTDYYKSNDDIEVIYYEDSDYIRINSNLSRSSYPVFCLEMIKLKDR